MYSPNIPIEINRIPNIKNTKMIAGATPKGNAFQFINFKMIKTKAKNKLDSPRINPIKATILKGSLE